MRLRWFVRSVFDMIVKSSDHYPGSALEVCVPPTDCRSNEYSVKPPIVRNVENLRVQLIIVISQGQRVCTFPFGGQALVLDDN